MPLSGTYTYTRNARQIVKDALIESGVIADHESVRGEMMDWGINRLNHIIKHLQTKGLQLWKMQRCVLVLVDSQEEYRLSDAGVYAATEEDMVVTELAQDELSGDSGLLVDSNVGIAASDIIGVQCDDGTMHWTTVASTAGTTIIALSAVLDADASEDNKVYAFTNYMPKPLRIYDAVYHDRTNDYITPLQIDARHDYFNLPETVTDGRVNTIYFNPNRTDAVLRCWPRPDNSKDTIDFTAQLPFATMVAQADELDFPDWWFEPIHLSLAYAFARSYQAPAQVQQALRGDALRAVQEAEHFDVETTQIWMHPDHPLYDG